MTEKLTLSDAHAQWLEDVRNIPCELAAEMGVVSKGPNIGFEYRQNGKVSFLKLRSPDKSFWIEPKGAALCLWNEDCLSEPSEAPLIVTEGEFDALSFLASGATHVVSVPNGSPLEKRGEGDITPSDDGAFRYLWGDHGLKPGLQHYAKIILATDEDHKGRVLRDELAIRLGRSRCWFVRYSAGCKDANEVLIRHGADAVQEMIADAKPIVPSRLVPFSEIPLRADARRYSLGWPTLDHHFMFVPPQLIVVTGKPNSGKSQWTLAAVANLARLHGIKGAILQFEDDPERNHADLLRYARAYRGPEQFGTGDDPVAWVDRLFCTISPREEIEGDSDFDLTWLKSAIEEAATRHGCKWVLIDPWNEVEHLWGRQDTEATYLNRALRELKRLCRKYQIAIIIVAHPTKEGGKSKTLGDADLYDISGGAVWNNKADIGVVVWCDDEPAKSRVRQIKVAKSKNFLVFGRPGVAEMTFNPERATFIGLTQPNERS
jgi:twinkle protein